MSTSKTPSPAPFSHLLRADPRLIAEMQRITHESIERDREETAAREAARAMRKAQKAAAQIVAANNRRLGISPPPTPTTALGKAIVRADERRRGG